MPTRLHACIGSWMSKCCCQWAVAGLLPPRWHSTVDIMSSPGISKPSPKPLELTDAEHDNFVGVHAGSFAEPDFCFVPWRNDRHREFPSVVIESGWWESGQKLKEDKEIWLAGSGAQVRVVLQAKFSPPDIQNEIGLTMAIWRAQPGGSAASQVIVTPFAQSPSHRFRY